MYINFEWIRFSAVKIHLFKYSDIIVIIITFIKICCCMDVIILRKHLKQAVFNAYIEPYRKLLLFLEP